MIWSVLHIIDILLWLIMAGSVMYVAFFAFVSLFSHPNRSIKKSIPPTGKSPLSGGLGRPLSLFYTPLTMRMLSSFIPYSNSYTLTIRKTNIT